MGLKVWYLVLKQDIIEILDKNQNFVLYSIDHEAFDLNTETIATWGKKTFKSGFVSF